MAAYPGSSGFVSEAAVKHGVDPESARRAVGKFAEFRRFEYFITQAFESPDPAGMVESAEREVANLRVAVAAIEAVLVEVKSRLPGLAVKAKKARAS